MKFDLNCSYQSSIVEANALKHVYKNMYQASTKTNWVRLTGPFIGVTAGLLSIARRVASIAENIIKGLANILGSPFHKNCQFHVGLDQLLGNVIIHLYMLPLDVLSAVMGVFINTLGTLVVPEKFLHSRWCCYDPVERKQEAQKATVSE